MKNITYFSIPPVGNEPTNFRDYRRSYEYTGLNTNAMDSLSLLLGGKTIFYTSDSLAASPARTTQLFVSLEL